MHKRDLDAPQRGKLAGIVDRVMAAYSAIMGHAPSGPYRRDVPLRHLSRGDPNRSKYMPAGPQRNCGHRGISPKSFQRALDAAIT